MSRPARHLPTPRRLFALIPLLAALAAAPAGAQGLTSSNPPGEDAPPPRPAQVLTLELTLKAAGREAFDGAMIIRNPSDAPVTAEHPGNRMGHSFLVMNALGNIALPTALTKVEPSFHTITIPPKGEFRYGFRQLSFVNDAGLFGYLLTPGTYRVVAIYRPAGGASEGIASAERMVVVPK